MKYRPLYDFWRKLSRNMQLSPEWENYQTFLKDNIPLYKPGTIPSRIDPSFPFRIGNIKWITSRRLSRYPVSDIHQMVQEGYTQRAIGELFHISQSTVQRILRDSNDNKEA